MRLQVAKVYPLKQYLQYLSFYDFCGWLQMCNILHKEVASISTIFSEKVIKEYR